MGLRTNTCNHSFEKVGEEYGEVQKHVDTMDDHILVYSKVNVVKECEDCGKTKKLGKKDYKLTRIPLEEIDVREYSGLEG